MSVLFPTAYWPNILYMYQVSRAEELVIESQEYFVKQSLRTRCEILSANGRLRLSIPVCKTQKTTRIKDVEISYRSKWQNEHWRALCSAYNNSPFFEYYKDQLMDFYRRDYPFLLDYNTAQLKLLMNLLGIKKNIRFTELYEKAPQAIEDLRFMADVKIGSASSELLPEALLTPYYQTFGTKFAFTANLSSLDLLFNTGGKALGYLSGKA